MNCLRRGFSVGYLAILFTLAPSAHAYVTYQRLGYVSCTACHFLQTGGGLLTPYGQSLGATLSAFPLDRDPPDRRLSQGAHVRALGSASANGGANPFLMQADYLAHAKVDSRLQLDFALGPNLSLGGPGEFASVPGKGDALILRRALASYRASDAVTIQGGRDFSVAGLNIADHTTYLRSRSRRNVLDYPTQLRVFYQKEQLQWLTYVSGPSFEEMEQNREYGAGTRAEYAFSQTNSFGVTGFFGDSPGLSRLALSLFARTSLAHWNGLIAEAAFISRKPHVNDSSFAEGVLYVKPYVAYPEWAELGWVVERVVVGQPFFEKTTRFGPSLNLRLHEYVSLLGDGRNTISRDAAEWSWYGQVFVHFQI